MVYTFQIFCTRWPGLSRQVNTHLVRECSFASWSWQETSFNISGPRQKTWSWALWPWISWQTCGGAIFPNLLMNFSLIVGNLSPANFNWQSNLLSQGENSPALPALIILYNKSGKYEMLVPKVSSHISYIIFKQRSLIFVLGFDFLF